MPLPVAELDGVVRAAVACRRNSNMPDVLGASVGLIARCGLGLGLMLGLAVDFLAWVAVRPTVGIGVLQGSPGACCAVHPVLRQQRAVQGHEMNDRLFPLGMS